MSADFPYRTRRTIKPVLMDSSREIAHKLLVEILEDAHWAPTHGLTQPWRFHVFTSQDERTALEKERLRIQNLSPKAFAQLIADLPSIRSRVEYLLEIAERQLPKGNPLFFWDTISKLQGILSHGIPDKVCAVKKQAGVGRALEQAETLEREAKLFHERLQSLADRAKGLEAFAQEHALRCAYGERQLKDFKWQLIRPKSSFTLGDFSDGGDGGGGGD